MQWNIYARDKVKLTNWKQKEVKDNAYNSTCEHTNDLNKDGNTKLIQTLAIIIHVIKYRNNYWNINILKLHASIECTKILRSKELL